MAVPLQGISLHAVHLVGIAAFVLRRVLGQESLYPPVFHLKCLQGFFQNAQAGAANQSIAGMLSMDSWGEASGKWWKAIKTALRRRHTIEWQHDPSVSKRNNALRLISGCPLMSDSVFFATLLRCCSTFHEILASEPAGTKVLT
mmetsp:Transcript_14741/g.50290  ORF Transcript_14741/g.50290 Transcript_14741/m.50290 type:complete len:144 (-) Transcript_14741:90-521(-)